MIHDLSYTIGPDTMAYPGTEKPKLKVMNTVETDGFQETLISIFSHAGTHMDAPAHMIIGAHYLDTLPMDRFCGKAYVMDCTSYVEGDEIPLDALPDLTGLKFLILSTGWEEKWGTDAYFGRFPVLSPEAADVVANAGLSGVGVDMMSVDPMDTVDFPVHMRFFNKNMVIIENLRNLASLRGKTVDLAALPLKYVNADGAPVRVAAFEA